MELLGGIETRTGNRGEGREWGPQAGGVLLCEGEDQRDSEEEVWTLLLIKERSEVP